MKKYILFAILGIVMLSTTSCKKEAPELTIADAVMSPVVGLQVVRLNFNQPFLTLCSYRVKNYGRTSLKVYGLQLDVSDDMYVTSGFYYGKAGTGISGVNMTNNYISFDNEVLSPGEETNNYNLLVQLRYPSGFYFNNYNGNFTANVTVKIKSIMTSRGDLRPQANTLTSISVVP